MSHLLGLIISLAFTTGCTLISAPEVQWVDPTTHLQWPAPPDKARIIYLRDFKGPADFEKTSSSQKFLTWLTGERDKKLPFIAPYGIAADGLGRIWVADMGIRGVHQIDLVKGKVSYIFSAGTTSLESPAGVAVDLERQRLYISDTTLAKVFLFDLDGRFIKEWDAPDNFGRPAGLAVDKSGQLYVVDAQKNRLSIFSQDGELRRTITSAALPELTFNTPSNVAVNAQGQIFVVDSMNFRIEIFSPEGESLGTIGSIGDGPGYFARPRGIAIDGDGHIYIADATFDNIQVFDSSGKLMIYYGQPGKKQAGEFSLPAGMTFDQHNRLYVVDSFNQRLQIFEYLP
ncbi:MAG: 6-bladed beta-propeller [Saprospiraceae bacterium]|nr:6-bladed beta-propeller [Saprospiraceae bacterium]